MRALRRQLKTKREYMLLWKQQITAVYSREFPRQRHGAPDGDEVLQRLAHLEALDLQVAQVQEVVHPVHIGAAARRAVDAVVVVAAITRFAMIVSLRLRWQSLWD